jgi:hypothetical protein
MTARSNNIKEHTIIANGKLSKQNVHKTSVTTLEKSNKYI